MQTKNFWQLLKETYHQWSEDKAARLAAAMSYYTLFSLAPLLVLAIAIAGYFFTQQTAENQIMSQVTNLAGPTAAEAMRGMIQNTHQGGANVVASILGLVLLLVGASGVFGSLQDALNTIWQVKMDPRIGVRAVILNRLFSFAMVLAIGFLLLVSLVVSAALTAVGTFFQNQLPAGTTSTLFQVFNIVISLVVITLLFAMIYRVVPDAEIDWKDVGVG
ncbi:MAG TPA: YihY/virulence factor BrkB family protein, partial [Anaerolineaceae bacterium]